MLGNIYREKAFYSNFTLALIFIRLLKMSWILAYNTARQSRDFNI